MICCFSTRRLRKAGADVARQPLAHAAILFKRRPETAQIRIKHVCKQTLDDGFLAREIPIDAAHAEPCFLGNVVHPRRFQSVAHKDPRRSSQNLSPTFLAYIRSSHALLR